MTTMTMTLCRPFVHLSLGRNRAVALANFYIVYHIALPLPFAANVLKENEGKRQTPWYGIIWRAECGNLRMRILTRSKRRWRTNKFLPAAVTQFSRVWCYTRNASMSK